MKSADTNKPHLIITVGIPSSGKSFFAEHFADIFKAPIISYDLLRRQIFTNPAFNDDEDEIIARVANHTLDEVLKTKRTVIYEGKTNLRADRIAIAKKAREAGYEPLFVWVQTEPSSAKLRATKASVEKPAMEPLTFDLKLKQFTLPNQSEKAIVISGKHTFASQLKIVLKHLIEPRVPFENQPESPPPHASRNYLIR
jgi:predicted kinase